VFTVGVILTCRNWRWIRLKDGYIIAKARVEAEWLIFSMELLSAWEPAEEWNRL